jgi:hypothetical protein
MSLQFMGGIQDSIDAGSYQFVLEEKAERQVASGGIRVFARGRNSQTG